MRSNHGPGGDVRATSAAPADPFAPLFDPVTRRHLDAVGTAAGWRCWEVGARGPSTGSWLAQRVGPGGRVLVTGTALSWATGAEPFEVRRHDVVADDPPEGAFDLVHARLALVHVAAPAEALARVVRSLRPGGWLVVEELDVDFQPCATPDATDARQYLSNRIRAGLLTLLREHGADLELGRKLPRLLRDAGVVDVTADGYLPLASPLSAALECAHIEPARHALVELRAATLDELDAHLGAARDGSIDVAVPPLISARGRRPLSPA